MLRIVLMEPREAGNVGASARVMKNFGFSSLTIAGQHPALDPLAGWWASGADDVVAQAAFASTLQAAIAGAHVTVATTSSRGRTRPADFSPESLARMFGTLAPDQTLALVFGREDRGLTAEEIAACQYTAVIPANPAFPTMNLAQAVGIFCFALSQVRPAEAWRDLAPAALVERLHERAQALLAEVGFLHGNNPDRIYDDLRIIAGRAALDQREAEILLGMIRQVEWRLRRTGDR